MIRICTLIRSLEERSEGQAWPSRSRLGSGPRRDGLSWIEATEAMAGLAP